MVDGKASLYPFRGPIRLYVRERFVRPADFVQYDSHQRKRDQNGMGPGPAPMEGKVSGTSGGSDPGLDRSHLCLLSSSARAEIYRAYLSRYGAHVLP